MLADANILINLTSTVRPGFDEAYNAITHPDKADLRRVLIYFDKVWDHMSAYDTKDELKFTHFHFPEMSESKKDILVEFIVLKQFILSHQNDREQSSFVISKIKRLETLIGRPLPEGAGSKSRSYKKWVEEKTRARQQLKILRKIPDTGKSFMPDTILNILQNDLDVLKENLFTVKLDALKNGQEQAYCLLNTDRDIESLSQVLDELGFLMKIRQIIVFDCENRGQVLGYNKARIDNLNAQGCTIKALIMCSFDKRTFRVSKLFNRITSIYQKYYVAIKPGATFSRSYIFYEKELTILSSARDSSMSIEWLGEENEGFYDYLDLAREFGIDKLRSIGVMNIFSIAVNNVIAERILKDLFSEDLRYEMFADELRSEVNELETGEKQRLRTSIVALLTNVINIWQDTIPDILKDSEGDNIAFVLPFQLVKMRPFITEWRNAFPGLKCKLYAWNALRDALITEKTVYVLTYRDAGRTPFELFPNILEHNAGEGIQMIGVFFKMFFNARYSRFIYPYLRAWNGLFANEFRYTYLQWAKVDAWISMQKIKNEEILVEADDREYGLAGPTEMVRVEHTDNTHISYYPSRQLIVRKKGSAKLKVIRAEDLLDDPHGLEVQALEDIHKDLNLFSITSEEKQELIDIKRAYGVMNDQELWKVLLARKAEESKDSLVVYKEILDILEDKSSFVRFEHFRNHWLDPNSTLLIPRKRSHFRSICEHLGLPRAYYRLKLKKRASLTSNSRQSNGQMNALLAQMFNEGLFGADIDWQNVNLQHLMESHELEEKGLTSDNLNSELNALVDLLKDKIRLKTIAKLELS